ncbi:DNA-binding protein inhibitor ID-2b [Mastacembelus armatus]|uniref:DNA-binding protein inhibitor ID-2b n=1 Tax=Mastacembelus armatus TaxID=205130 RepID=UPI000E454AA6|nr:DNA-binding protein inhibitor ID-1-like [Mastacembelus armatus]
MRSGSPVLPAGRSRRGSGRRVPGLSRNKSPEVEFPHVPVLLPRDMDLCYRLLRQLVPGLPPGRAASRVEILRHVIDYILDLQTELDDSSPAREPGAAATELPEPTDKTEKLYLEVMED